MAGSPANVDSLLWPWCCPSYWGFNIALAVALALSAPTVALALLLPAVARAPAACSLYSSPHLGHTQEASWVERGQEE